MTRWLRSPASPMVWKVLEGYEILDNGIECPIKFSIQEIPQNRRQEALDHLYMYFLVDEPLSKSCEIQKDLDGVNDFRTFWNYGLDQGVSIGCYKLDSNEKICKLAGVNILFVVTNETIEDFQKLKTTIKSDKFRKIWDLFDKLNSETDAFEMFKVNQYIGSVSLSVAPSYRGQKLGYHMLNTRRDIGKHYGINATCTMFTARQSQEAASLAGFEEKTVLAYADYKDDKGNEIFPKILSKNVKMMGKILQ